MPAITATLTAVAGLGASIGQMIKASQAKKKAAALGLQSTIQAKSEVPINTLTDLGIADREFEKGMIRDLEANAISTLQQDPRTALGGTANINRQTEEQTAKLGQQIAEDVIERDRLIATQDQEIEDTRSERAYDIAVAEAEGYGEMEADAQSEFNTAATAAIGLGADIGAATQEYAAWKKANVSAPKTTKGKSFPVKMPGSNPSSDIALKENINLVGKSPSGINIYEFKYINKEGRYRGVMAQEVPWASRKEKDGYLSVDYSKIDVDFEQL